MDSNSSWPTSPVKKHLPITQNRQEPELSQQLKVNVNPAVVDFLSEHLNLPPPVLLQDIEARLVKLIPKFRSNKSHDKSYQLACNILGIISELSHKHLNIGEGDRIVFIDHHSSDLTHHPGVETKARPDIGAIRQSHFNVIPDDALAPKTDSHKRKRNTRPQQRYYRLPWHLFDSVVELKSMRDAEGPSQISAYAGFLNQARPDKPGVYCIYLSPREYRIVWSDPSGLFTSQSFAWEDIGPLAAYVFSLYDPPQDHVKVDSTITLDESSDITGPPRWTVKFQSETYPSCTVLFVGSPWTRQSWVAISADFTAGGRRIIKDQYHAKGRLYDEGGIFDILQSSGEPAPGCVYVQCHGDVDGVFTANMASRRQKKRVVMTTIGIPLYDCPSLFEFLKVMYDTLEVHRWIFQVKGILHRDISMNNILLPTAATTMIPGDEERPKFINEILNPDKVGAASCALLCDFDNACVCRSQQPTGLAGSSSGPGAGIAEDEKTDEIKRVSGELKNRTGTPAFIARSVALGRVLSPHPPPPMPALEGDIKAAYESVYGHDELRRYEDANGQRHGGQLMADEDVSQIIMSTDDTLKERFFHQPCHDAESVFWVIVMFLLRIRPAEDVDEGEDDVSDHNKTNSALDALWKPLIEHSIGSEIDSREVIFTTALQTWKAALHPKLAFLAPMLMQLASQVRPEYSFVKPRPQELHLHEAMQRILFRTIWSMRTADHVRLSGKFQMVTINRAVLQVHTFQPLTGTKHPTTDEEPQQRNGKRAKRD